MKYRFICLLIPTVLAYPNIAQAVDWESAYDSEFNLARQAMGAHDYRSALVHMNRSLKRNGFSSARITQRAMANAGLGNYHAAMADCAKSSTPDCGEHAKQLALSAGANVGSGVNETNLNGSDSNGRSRSSPQYSGDDANTFAQNNDSGRTQNAKHHMTSDGHWAGRAYDETDECFIPDNTPYRPTCRGVNSDWGAHFIKFRGKETMVLKPDEYAENKREHYSSGWWPE